MASSTSAISNSLCNSSSLPLPLLIPRSSPISPQRRQSNRASSTSTTSASRNYGNYGGGGGGGGRSMVDENLIVLRKRIHEMKMMESEYEPPAHWMEWEKNCYAGKDEFVVELMEWLQSRMMDARPCLVLGAILIVALSVPTSAAVVWFQILALIKAVFT